MVKLSIFFNIFVLASALSYTNAVPIPTPNQVQPPPAPVNGQSSEARNIQPGQTQTPTDPRNGPQRGPPTASQRQAAPATVATATPREGSTSEKPEASTGKQLAPTVPGSPAPAESTAPVQGPVVTPRLEPPSQKPADKGQQGVAAKPTQALPGTTTPPAAGQPARTANTASLQEEGRQQSTQNATANVSAPETRENATLVQRQPQHKGQQGAQSQGQQEPKPAIQNSSPVKSSRPQQESSRSRQTPEGQQAQPRTNATAANVLQVVESPHTPGTTKPSTDLNAPQEALAGAANAKQNATVGQEENQQAQGLQAHKGPENVSSPILQPNQTPENQRTQGSPAPKLTAEATAERTTQRGNSTSQQTPKEAHPRHPGQQASQAQLQAAGTSERTGKPVNNLNAAVTEGSQPSSVRNETRPEEPPRAATGQHAGVPQNSTTSSFQSNEKTRPVDRPSTVGVTAAGNAPGSHPAGTNHRAQATGQQAPQEISKSKPAPEGKLQATTGHRQTNNSSEAVSDRPLATGQQANSNEQRPQQQAVRNQTGGQHASGNAEAQKQSAIGLPKLPAAGTPLVSHRQEAPQSLMQHQSAAQSTSGRVPNHAASAEEPAQAQTLSKPSPNQAAAPANTRTPSPLATVASASQAPHATSKVQQSHQAGSAQQTTSAANPLASNHLAAVLARRPAAATDTARQQAQRARLQLLLPQQSTAIPTGPQSQTQTPAPYYITQPRGSQQSALLLQRLASNPIMRAQANHRRLIEATQNDQFFRMQRVHPELLLANRRRPAAPQSTGQAVSSPAKPAANAPTTVPQARSPQAAQQTPQAQRIPAAHNPSAAKATTATPAGPTEAKQTTPTQLTPARQAQPTASSTQTPSAVSPTHKVPASRQAEPGLAPNAYELSRRVPEPAAHSTNVSAPPKTQEPAAQPGSHAAKDNAAAATATASQATATSTERKPTSTTQPASMLENEHKPAQTSTTAASSQESKASLSQQSPVSHEAKHKSSNSTQAKEPTASPALEGQSATSVHTVKASGQANPKVEEPTKLGNETSAISSEAKNGAANTSQQSTLASAVSQERTPAKSIQPSNPTETKQATPVTQGKPVDKPKDATDAARQLTLEGEDAFGGPTTKTPAKASVTPKA